jgi:hypothetical protein
MLYHELLEHLKKLDEVTLLEILDISSEEIVDRFTDLIEKKIDYLEAEFEDDGSED